MTALIKDAPYNGTRSYPEARRAARGTGATRNGHPISVNGGTRASDGPITVSRNEIKRGLLAPFQNAMHLEAAGGMCHKLVMVATGEASATFTCHTRCEWDMAAGVIILAEAGGTTSQLDGMPIVFNQPSPVIEGIVASNGHEHAELLGQIQYYRTR